MKILRFLPLVATILLLLASCGGGKKVIKSAPDTSKKTPVVVSTQKERIPGIRGLILLHPIGTPIDGDGKTFDSFYDFSNRTLDLMDERNDYDSLKNFLPLVIKPGSPIYGVRFESMITPSFTHFTNDVKTAAAKNRGSKFGRINNYQTAYASNARLEQDSLYILNAMLDMLLERDTLAPKQYTADSLVEGGESMFIMHPMRDTLVFGNKKLYVFYSYKDGCAYMTDSTSVYETFRGALPLHLNPGETENAVLCQGILIDPYTDLEPALWDAITKKKGFQLNGGSDEAKSARHLRILWMTGLTVVLDYKKVTNELQKKIDSYGRPPVVPKKDKQTTPKPTPTPVPTPNTATSAGAKPNAVKTDAGVTYPRNHH